MLWCDLVLLHNFLIPSFWYEYQVTLGFICQNFSVLVFLLFIVTNGLYLHLSICIFTCLLDTWTLMPTSSWVFLTWVDVLKGQFNKGNNSVIIHFSCLLCIFQESLNWPVHSVNKPDCWFVTPEVPAISLIGLFLFLSFFWLMVAYFALLHCLLGSESPSQKLPNASVTYGANSGLFIMK